MGIVRNRDYWPLEIQTVSGKPNRQELDSHLAILETRLNAGEKWAVIMDVSKGTPPAPNDLLHYTRFLKAHHDQIRDTLLGFAVVADSEIVRMTVNGLLSLTPLAAPTLIVDTLKDAIEYIEPKFESAGIVTEKPLSALRRADLDS